jgi:hypothetical protein
MFHRKVSKKEIFLASLIMLVFFIVSAAGLWLVIDSLRIGPGLPPPEVMSKWYIPDASKGNAQVCTSLFPKISPYCNVANTSGRKLISVWYFDNESEFITGEDTLYRYLNENGNVSQQKLNIVTGVIEETKTVETSTFNTTKYESPETSGYFLVYEKPFLETHEDDFIVYYGIRGMTNLTKETPALKDLIAKSYYMCNKKGKVDSLKMGDV